MFTHQLDEATYLKPLHMNDAEEIFTLIQKSDNLSPWLPFVEFTKEVADTESYIKSALAETAKGNGFQAVIVHNEHVAGLIGFHFINKGNNSTEIGYWLGKDFEGKGIMTKACQAMVDHVFRDLDLYRVVIKAAVENEKSLAIPTRLGFKQDGVLRANEKLTTGYSDSAVFSLLKPEWEQRASLVSQKSRVR
ncbi:GNAT family N-acetyltransferase [Paenalkalicoccus suaedae]|uniref:GNAT family N-acetyltransferase n=1 Tax=Paenalkalicoccus suaedae TaxID=2592382 RepID=A0A859FAS2_9BACI|nr:GNAT family protein [Paenalkalicoccus suaedae]QKS70433.1 GNAT family N-acetyltransferase [Paenalkalicoccus suaedae]